MHPRRHRCCQVDEMVVLPLTEEPGQRNGRDAAENARCAHYYAQRLLQQRKAGATCQPPYVAAHRRRHGAVHAAVQL